MNNPEDIRFVSPREKLISYGPASLSNPELISLIVGTGNQQQSALQTANSLLDITDHNLSDLSKLSVARIAQVNGISPTKATTIAAAFELAKRIQNTKPINNIIIGSIDIENMFAPMLRQLQYEEVWVVHLSTNKTIINRYRLSSGGTANSTIDIKILLRNAVEQLAEGVVIVHNHPTGDPKPSDYDVTITRRVANAANIMDIKLLDHVIIGQNENFSFAENGLL